ncbi:MAG TPA: SDR family NAD(P)-dependent oxidoreductase [Pyrinomonadaceae bacterium]|nr:SDR family NAD(P)-dependent oxidoreductase [Pyrinomonadaceae bacterium]
MQLSGNTILVTGGASGIGLAIATRFLETGNEVIICGRREDKLNEAAAQCAGLRTRICDLASDKERKSLVQWAIREFPNLNVLVNNAGIQRALDLRGNEAWESTHSEIAINLEAPIELSRLLYPHLMQQPSAAILNVTSGLSFVPLANVPVYCATKAALHSFTLSLRQQLSGGPVEVIEIIPPAVDTDLQAPGLHKFGVNVDEFADAVFLGLEAGESEIAYGNALAARTADKKERETLFKMLNERFS